MGGMQIVTALAVATLIGGPLLALNPLLSWESIGEWPLLNLLLLVYGLPALLLAALGYALEPSADRRLAIVLQGLGGAVGLFFVSLEIRQLFHGTVLVLGDIGLAELSCIIIAWLLIALGLFRLAVGERGGAMPDHGARGRGPRGRGAGAGLAAVSPTRCSAFRTSARGRCSTGWSRPMPCRPCWWRC